MKIPADNSFINLNHGKIATKNKMGAMVTKLSDISKQFIADTEQLSPEEIIVDVGCCYGIATLAVLEQSQCKIIGIDLSEEHLQILRASINQENSKRLTTIAGFFPEAFKATDGTIAAIHASHLLQFLTGKDIEKGIIKCYNALQSQGKVYFSTTSIYLPWTKSFLPIYKQREASGEPWPGEISNFVDYAPDEAKEHVQSFFHVLTKEKLCNTLEKAGFVINRAFYYDVNNPADQANDNKEMIGIIATKK